MDSPTQNQDTLRRRLAGVAEKKKAKPGRHDVAKLAGVSPTTVSLVMNNRGEELRISPETRQRVLDAARELNYNPNPLMQSILRGRTHTISFWIPREAWDSQNPYWTDMLKVIREAASDVGYDILIHHHRTDEDVRIGLSRMAGGLVDGVIIVPVEDDVMARGLAESHVPVVALDNPHPGLPGVHCDSDRGMELIVEHVLAKGHRSVAYFDREGVPIAAASERLNTLRRTLARHGIELPEERIVRLPDPTQIEARHFVSMNPRPTAVFCFNDFRAHLLVNALHREGFAVPDDMAVTGFDGTRDQPMTSGMKLTSYDVRTEEAYRTAVRLLLDVIDGRPIPQENLVPGELIVGETT